MFRLLLLLIIVSSLNGCSKENCGNEKIDNEEKIKGKWIREGTDGTGSGNTLTFSKHNNSYRLSFTCSGSPGPDRPSSANVEYKFVNDKLAYTNYYDPTLGFYTTTSFKWIKPGEKFEILFRDLLFFMSANTTVTYKRAPL